MRIVYFPYTWMGNESYLQLNVENYMAEKEVLHNSFKSSALA